MGTWADLAVVEVPEAGVLRIGHNWKLDGMSVVQSSNFTVAVGLLEGGQLGLVYRQVVVAGGQDALALLHHTAT